MSIYEYIKTLGKKVSKLEFELCCLRTTVNNLTIQVNNISNLVSQNIISDENNLLMSEATTFYTFNGTTATTWRLPDLVASSGTRRTIVNQGTDELTINSFAGGNDIWDAGIDSNTFSIMPGESYIFFNNSIYHTLIQ